MDERRVVVKLRLDSARRKEGLRDAGAAASLLVIMAAATASRERSDYRGKPGFLDLPPAKVGGNERYYKQ